MSSKKEDIKAMRKALDDCKKFLDEMEYPELQGAGLALQGGLQYEIDATSEEGTEFTPENIYVALKKRVDEGENGDEAVFRDAYTKTIIAVHMIFGINEYHKFLMWFFEKSQEGFDTSILDVVDNKE